MSREYKIGLEEAKQRLDAYLSDNTEHTRNKIQIMIGQELVLVNGEVKKANYKLKIDDIIVVTEMENIEVDIVPEDLSLEIIYEDKDVAVVNKPRGMVVHPANGHTSGTLVNGLMHQITDLSGINGELRPGIVHRIDKDTSGLLMIAKNDTAHNELVDQLVNRSVNRRYVALVHGVIPHDKGKINAPIGRSKRDRKLQDIVEGGKEAITNFTVLKRYNDYTLVECKLETGRTHQIRVHMKYIGHALVGDTQYGPKKAHADNGQLLHAKVIGFNHPVSNEYIEFTVEPDKYFTDFINKLDRES